MQVDMRGIVKRFGAATALNGVDFAIVPGEIHAILGENGAGKSTLMHVLSGALKAGSGEIRLDGKPVQIASPRTARRLGIAMVHQHFTLVPAFTVVENLALDAHPARTGIVRFAAGLRWSAHDDAAPALERARSLGWTLPPDARVADLPVGTQQRVEIVKTLATGARTLIFDEPTAVLTASEVDELFAVLRRLRSEGCAVVLIAHKLAEILAVADRITVLRHGERVATVLREETDARKLAAWMMGVPPPAAGPAESDQEVSGAMHRGGQPGPTGIPHTALHPQESTASSPSLTASNLAILGDRGEQSVREVSFDVRPGEIFGIGGVDGNGQAELAEALVGLRPLTSGQLKWHGGEFRPGLVPAAGYIPQDRRRSGLAVTMTVEENLILDAVSERRFGRGAFLRRRALREMASDLIRRFDIRTAGLQVPVSSLSGGNQQKIVVARALRSEPEWIVAVNPTRGLDIGATQFVWEQLRRARDRGASIVLISTDLDEIAALADRAAILFAGRLTEADLDTARAEEVGLLLGGGGGPREVAVPAPGDAVSGPAEQRS